MEDKRQALLKTFEIIDEYLKADQRPETPVLEYLSPKELETEMDIEISAEGSSDDELLDYIRGYLKYSVRTGHSQYLNQLFGGRSYPALFGEFITALTNTSLYTYEAAPVATLIERSLIKKMCRYAGFENGEGAFVTGGSNTNLIALLTARNELFPESKEKGTWGMAPMTAFVSDQAHYSFAKAANTMGIGMRNIILVKTDELGRMIPEELDREIIASKEREEQPFFVAATGSTTELGAFDPIEKIGEVARKHKLWYHVDGSWGGSILLSRKHRHMFDGLEKANSFSWNPHKMMNVPLICSAILVNGQGVLLHSLSSNDTDYLFHENDHSSYDLGNASLQCGKRVDVLKLWLSWKHLGDEGYEQRVNHQFDMAQYATDIVKNHPRLELLAPTQSLNINFRFQPETPVDDIDKLNEQIRETMFRDGKSMVNYCHLDNGLSIRLVLTNGSLQKEDIDRFFENFLHYASLTIAPVTQ